jgi:peptidoglycan hydrolase CwlO-like protein
VEKFYRDRGSGAVISKDAAGYKRARDLKAKRRERQEKAQAQEKAMNSLQVENANLKQKLSALENSVEEIQKLLQGGFPGGSQIQ